MPATAPRAIAPSGLTFAPDGVMATRPAMAPDAAPSVVAALSRTTSTTSQPRIAAAVATVVFSSIDRGDAVRSELGARR